MKQLKAIHDLFLFEDDLFRNGAEIIWNEPCTGIGQNNGVVDLVKDDNQEAWRQRDCLVTI